MLPLSMLALRSAASPPPSVLSPTTRHPSPPTPVELMIGKVSLGPLGNTSFSGSTGIGTMSLSGLSLTASGNDSPSVLLPLATMVPSCSRKVLGAIRRHRAVWLLRLGDGHHDRQQQGPLLPLPQEEHIRQGHLRHE